MKGEEQTLHIKIISGKVRNERGVPMLLVRQKIQLGINSKE